MLEKESPNTTNLTGEALREHLANHYKNTIGTSPVDPAATLPASGRRFDIAALVLVASQQCLELVSNLPL